MCSSDLVQSLCMFLHVRVSTKAVTVHKTNCSFCMRTETKALTKCFNMIPCIMTSLVIYSCVWIYVNVLCVCMCAVRVCVCMQVLCMCVCVCVLTL